jgi:HAD superfamily hydrolase (TIGR01549 family)
MDETLILADPKLGEFIYQQVAARGITIDSERRDATERWLLYHWMQPAYILADPQIRGPVDEYHSHKSWRKHLEVHLRMLGVEDGSIEAIAQDLVGPISTYQSNKTLAPDAIATLEYLANAGYRLGLLTNRMDPIRKLAETLGIAGYFELISSGGELGFLKPDPRFFFKALDQLDAVPSQAIYIGDNYYADIVGAQFAGLTAILIDPNQIFPNAGCRRISSLSELTAFF